jgi:hypothetical protein
MSGRSSQGPLGKAPQNKVTDGLVVIPAEAHPRQLRERRPAKSPFEGGLRGMFSGNHTPLAPLEGGIATRNNWHSA